MPTRNVNLTDDQDAFVEKMVRAGKYQNASEVMRDALRGLQQRWEEDALKLELLRKSIDAGVADLENGNYEDMDDDAYARFLGLLDAPPEPSAEARKRLNRKAPWRA